MAASSPSPLTPREQAVADFFRQPVVADACMVIAATMIGLFACALGRARCAPITAPQGGAGAGYCAKMAHGYSWIVYAATAAGVALAVRWIWRWSYARRVALVIVTVAAVSATAWVFSLPAAVD